MLARVLGGDWEEAISRIGKGCLIACTDHSKDELGRVADRWCGPQGAEGSVLVGTVAMGWDGKIAGMKLALESLPVAPALLLSNSQAAISVVCNAAACGWARTADLKAVVDPIVVWAGRGVPLRLAWVKAHVGVSGNERADGLPKAGCLAFGDPQVTEWGVRALWKWLRAGQRGVVGLCAGRAPRWGRRAISRYAQARTRKGDLGIWRRRLGRGDGLCRLCRGGEVETGDHLVFNCAGMRGFVGWDWRGWIDWDDRSRWAYEYELGGRVSVGDQVEDFFSKLDRELCGVG